MFSKQLTAVFLCVLPALAAPSSLIPVKRNENPVPGSYFVLFKENVDHYFGVSSVANLISSRSVITNELEFINGVAGTFSDADVELLRALSVVASIEEEGYVHAQSTVVQTNAPWGLGRISSQAKLTNQDSSALTFDYQYDTSGGYGVDIYIIDSGIDVDHPAFEGRASWGDNILPSYLQDKTDRSGHGTHSAGIAISGPYGVAKQANAFAVKVMNSEMGRWIDVFNGMQWVKQRANATGHPSVATMNFRAVNSPTVNAAALSLSKFGVTVVASAGNDNVNAFEYSPANEPSAITVGASTIADAKADFSNYGDDVDVYAPGVDIISTWPNNTTKSISGTSVASSFVAGYAGYILAIDSSLKPEDVRNVIQWRALEEVLTGIPPNFTNRLLNVIPNSI